MIDLLNIVKGIKLTPKVSFGIAIGSGFLLYIPSSIEEEYGLFPFTFWYRDWISIIFIFSCAITFSYFIFWMAKGGKDIAMKIMFRLKSIRALKNLSSEERKILSNYIIHDTKSWKMDIDDGISASLIRAGVIYQASNTGDIIEGFSFNLQPWIWIKLRKKPNLLEPELTQKRKQLESRSR